MYRVIEETKGRYEILFVGSYEDCEKYALKCDGKVFIEKDFLFARRIATEFDSPGGVKNQAENLK